MLAYALDVGDGREIAGPHVRAACARHLRDLKDGPARGLVWDLEAAMRAIRFFRTVLRVDRTAADPPSDDPTKPFELLGWQAFCVGSLFGWKTLDGYRRFRVAFILGGKGCGKTPMASGIGLYMLVADGEYRAEVYAAAVKKDQARVPFRDAVAMVQRSPALASRLQLQGTVDKHNIAHVESGSFFRPISSEQRGRGQSGPRPHCGLIDEVHEHPTNAMVEFMRAGTKGRRQALILLITNTGSDRESVCYAQYEYGAAVAAGDLEDDSYFAYICGLDEGDDPLHEPDCWAKANPSLDRVVTRKYLAEQVREALGMPSKQNLVLRLNFCVWTDADDAWIGKAAWEACEVPLDLAEFEGLPCYAAIDLSAKLDLTALSLVFPNDDGSYAAFTEFWTPADTLSAREDLDGVPYRIWRDGGFLTAVPGKSIDYAWVAERLREIDARFDLRALGFDRWRMDLLVKELEEIDLACWTSALDDEDADGEGLRLVKVGQGFRDMSPAIEATEELIVNGRLQTPPNPVLRWNVASVVTEQDAAANRKFSKRKATGRIDGVQSLAMAVRVATALSGSDGDGGDFEPFVLVV